MLRRHFLGTTALGAALLGLGRIPEGLLVSRAQRSGVERALVVVQLSGGNDGLNTVVPFADDLYHAARPRLGSKQADTLALNEHLGFHKALKSFPALHASGQLATILGIGYANPVRSHFSSMDIWHAADARGKLAGSGWLGRLAETGFPDAKEPELIVHVGNRVPFALSNKKHAPVAFAAPAGFRWRGGKEDLAALEKASASECMEDAPTSVGHVRGTFRDAVKASRNVENAVREFKPATPFPENGLSAHLQSVAAMLTAGFPTRIYSLELGGFDTHNQQLTRQARCLDELDALGAFQAELKARKLDDKVLVLVYSEFGRRVAENGSQGTDHGAAGVAFLLGSKVKGGLHGSMPSLKDLERGDLRFTTDFRTLYAPIIAQWFGMQAAPIIGEVAEPLAVL